jgi:hypothetical protein
MWTAAVNVDKFMFGKQTAVDTGAEILKSFARATAPVAPSETAISKHPLVWMAQTFSPQVVKPLVNVALDVDTFGSALTNSRFGRDDRALALQGRKGTPEQYKLIAEELAKFGIDMYPEQVRAIVKGYAVGPANELIKAMIENPHKTAAGKVVTNQWFDRYITTQDNEGLRDRLYYRYRDELNRAAVKDSLGIDMTEHERSLADLAKKVKKLEASANGKAAAATKATRKGGSGAAYDKQAAALRDTAKRMVISAFKADGAG